MAYEVKINISVRELLDFEHFIHGSHGPRGNLRRRTLRVLTAERSNNAFQRRALERELSYIL